MALMYSTSERVLVVRTRPGPERDRDRLRPEGRRRARGRRRRRRRARDLRPASRGQPDGRCSAKVWYEGYEEPEYCLAVVVGDRGFRAEALVDAAIVRDAQGNVLLAAARGAVRRAVGDVRRRSSSIRR